MVSSPFRRFETPPAPPTTEDELIELIAEAERRGVNIGPALALATSSEEAVANIRTRLAAEARPGVQTLRDHLRANYPEQPRQSTPRGEGFFEPLTRRPEPGPDAGGLAGFLDRLLPGVKSLAIPELPESAIKNVPARLQPAARAVRELTSTLALATLPIGGVKGGLLGAGGFVGGSQAGSEIAGPKGELIGGIIGGVAAPLAPAAGRAATKGAVRVAEDMGKANVGNVLLPPAPKRVTQPLIYDDLTPVERQLFGLEPKARLTPDEIEGARDYLYGPRDPGTGRRPGGVVSPEDTARLQDAEEGIGNLQSLRQAGSDIRGGGQKGDLQDLIDDGLLFNLERSEKDPTTFRWRGKSLDEVFQSLPESNQNALPRVDATGREINDVERMVLGMQHLRNSVKGTSPRAISALRGEIDSVLSKYAPEPPAATGPIAQAGFGGEFGTGQVARGAAEQARMTQAPLSEIAASEADRIATVRSAAAAPTTGRQVARAATGGDPFLDQVARLTQDVSTSGEFVRAKDLYRAYKAAGGTLTESDFASRIARTAGPNAPIETLSVSRPGQEKGWISFDRPTGGRGYLGGVRVRRLPPPDVAAPPEAQVARAATDIPQSSAEAAARGGLPPRGPQVAGAAGTPPASPPVQPPTGSVQSPVGQTVTVPAQGRAPLTQPQFLGRRVPGPNPVPMQGSLIPPTAPPPPPPTGKIGGPPTPPPPLAFLPGMQRSSIAGNIIGLRDIKPGLTKGEELQNILLGSGRKAKLPFRLNNEYGTAAIREKERVSTAITSQATQLANRQAVGIRQAFKLEDDLFVPALAGKVGRVKGAPSIQDIADFYPQYEPFLTAAQKAALKPIVDTHAQYTDLLNKVGIGIPSRASTRIGGGNYIARVAKGLKATEDEPRGVPARGLFAQAKKGFEQEIAFETAAEGRAAGIKYAGIEDALRFHYQQAGQRATEAHVANYLTTVADDVSWPISLPRRGEMGRKGVDLAVLADYSFPEAVADSINKVLVSQGSTVGQGRNLLEAVRILNRGYRSVKATLDNSFMGIQALLSAYSHPVAASKAAKVNFQSWKDPKVLTRFMESFDAKATGRLTSTQWISEGNLHLGATTGEFAVEGLQGLPGFKQAGRAYGFTGDSLRLEVADSLLEQEMHGFRLFGKGPDLIGKGRTLDEIRASGDLAKIGEIANNMTGVARKRFGGDVGELLLFAPRFLESRLETVGKALAGLRPGASIEQKIARRSLLKMMVIGTGLTVALNELAGEDTDFRPIVNGRKNTNFMRVRALGRDWSLFGTWDSLLGLMIAAGHADVEGAVRSQASGLVTTTWDLMSGSDFIGRSTRSPENIALYIGRQLLPFSGEQTVEGTETALSGKPADIAKAAVVAASTLIGAKSSPLSFTDHANEIAQAKYGTTWDRLKAERDAALEVAVNKGKSTSPEYARLDARMDKIADEVDKKYPEDAVPSRLTASAKREEMAQRRYGRAYNKLYTNQRAKINRLISEAGRSRTTGFVPGRYDSSSGPIR